VGDIYDKMFFGSLVHTSTVLLRRERLEKVKAFREDFKVLGEDFDFHMRTTEHGPVGFVDVSSVEYQVGMPDQATAKRHMVHAARNCLRTIDEMMQQHPERLKFPRRRIRRRYADVHAWIGETLLEIDQWSGARRHLLRSLRYWPWHMRTARLLALTAAPRRVGDSARSLYRQMKRPFVTAKA